MLVEKDHDLIIAKMFCIQLSLKKVFRDLRFNRCVTCIYYLSYIEFFRTKKIK